MDKVKKVVPKVRNFGLNAPLVFAPNVQVTHAKSWNGDMFGYYRPMMEALSRQPNTQKVIFLPNFVSPVATIEERAKQLAQNIVNKREELNCERMHLVTHSFAGVDARAAISMFDLDLDVRSLTTLATPHLGLTLIQKIMDRPADDLGLDYRQLERALTVVGLGTKNVKEFGYRNMSDFNNVVEDSPRVEYFSFGTKKRELQLNELLKNGYEIITEHKIQYECDGMVEIKECRWGKYLLTFDHDHFELVGLNPSVKPKHVANLVTDNLKRSETDVQLNKKSAKM